MIFPMLGFWCSLFWNIGVFMECSFDRGQYNVIIPMAISIDRSTRKSGFRTEQLFELYWSYEFLATFIQYAAHILQ